MMKGLLRLAAVRDTKQAGELRGDTIHFTASSSALVLMTQNENIYRPLMQTATCSLPRYRIKHVAENSQWISRTTNSLTAPLTKTDQVRFCEVVNTCAERRGEKRIQRTAWILSHVLCTTMCELWTCERFVPSRMAQWAVYYKALVLVRTYSPCSWATGRNTSNNNLIILNQIFFADKLRRIH